MNPHGNGLGLYMCKQMAELMQGTIIVDSTYGFGSTFTLSVPLPLEQRLGDNLSVSSG